MEEIIKKIKKKIFVDDDSPEFFNSNYKNFEKIEKSQKSPLIFIDGGSQEIFKAPNISLYFNRIYYCVYDDKKRKSSKKYEFYSLVYTENIGKELFYKVDILFTKNKFAVGKLEFSTLDKSMMYGKNMVDISSIGNSVRKLLEIKLASLIEDNGIIVLDRNLEAKISYEDEFLKELYENAKKRNNIVCALSKTSSLLTKKGNSVNALLNSIGPDTEWSYKVAESRDFNIHFVKLNSKSKYTFRLDILKECDDKKIFHNLRLNSKDPVFLGYPYGLIEADSNARVSNKEIDFLEMQLIVKFGKDFNKFKKYLQSQDAHSILDNIG